MFAFMFSFLFFLSETIPLIFFDPFSDRILCSKPRGQRDFQKLLGTRPGGAEGGRGEV